MKVRGFLKASRREVAARRMRWAPNSASTASIRAWSSGDEAANKGKCDRAESSSNRRLPARDCR